MKVLLINGSPNARGCTYTALNEVATTLEYHGVETEIIQVGHKDVRGCIACRKCKSTGKCVFNDIVNEVAPKFDSADGLIVGSPVYYASPNGTLISFLDRLFFSTAFDKAMKVGASVVSCRRGGNTASFDMLNKYFAISQMPIVTSQYWNMVHGNSAQEVMQDLEGLQTMRTLGKNAAFLIKAIDMAKGEVSLPVKEERVGTNFIR
ncbi:MAG: flavodoxin family protein [Erysipelotrichaceae bacterium]|nr:flavodoxin family protein [Erysipelotrichaceae bacterium]